MKINKSILCLTSYFGLSLGIHVEAIAHEIYKNRAAIDSNKTSASKSMIQLLNSH